MNWKQRVSFRDLTEDFDTENDELEEIKRIKPMWVERFNSIESLKHLSEGLKPIKTQTQFNNWLDKVFDYCDRNGIWVEL